MNFLLGKKLKFVILGLLLIVVISFIVSTRINNTSYNRLGGTSEAGGLKTEARQKIFSNIARQDSDNDGLKDWEESLWGTDLYNEDTDKDGMKDGEEVDINRNPLKAGPDDELGEDILVKSKKTRAQYEDLNETEKFSQEFFKEYLSLKNSGISFDDASAQEFLLSSTLGKIQIDGGSKIYTSDDINIINDNSKEAIRVYGNTIGATILRYSAKEKKENEMLILRRALETNNQDELKKLDLIIVIYRNILNDSLKISTPQNMTNIHLGLINSFSQIASSIEGMRRVFTDPLMTLNKIGTYQEDVNGLFIALQDINKYFQVNNIVFSSNEDGYIFANILP